MVRHVAVLVLSLPVLAMSACRNVDELILGGPAPEARIAAVNLRDLSVDQVTLGVVAEVTNSYSAPLPLLGFHYAVRSGPATVVTGSAGRQGLIPANGTERFPFDVRLEFSRLLQAVEGVRPGTVVPYAVEVGLLFDLPVAGRYELPLRHEGRLPVPAVPVVTLAEIDWGEVSVNRIEGVLVLGIRNPNDFPLDLTDLDLALSLGGRDLGRAAVRSSAGLPAGGAGRVEVPARFSPTDAGIALVNLLLGSGSDYRLAGRLAAGTPYGPVSLPFDSSGSTSFSR